MRSWTKVSGQDTTCASDIVGLFLRFFILFSFYTFLSFSLTWDHMGGKISNDIASEIKQQIHSRYSYQSWLKNELRNSNFGFLPFFVCFHYHGTI